MIITTKDLKEFMGKFVKIETEDNGYTKTYRGQILEHSNKKILLFDRFVGKMLIDDKAITLIKTEDPGAFSFKLREFDKKADRKLGIK